jgi:hypothetical protein
MGERQRRQLLRRNRHALGGDGRDHVIAFQLRSHGQRISYPVAGVKVTEATTERSLAKAPLTVLNGPAGHPDCSTCEFDWQLQSFKISGDKEGLRRKSGPFCHLDEFTLLKYRQSLTFRRKP